MTPEAAARQIIDQKLERAGWTLQDMKSINLGAASGVAVREYPTDTGPVDYLLFVDRQPVGVIEAKRDDAGENITAHETQTERFRYFDYKTLVARDKASLDIFWLKDDSLDNLDSLPPPAVLAQEIVEHLQAALVAFRDVAAGLAPADAVAARGA